MIYSNNYSVLNERTEKEVQLSTWFDQCFKTLTNQEWDTKKIDKAIAEIEKCQDKIKRYKSGKFDLSIMIDKEYIKKLITTSLCYGLIGGVLGAIFGPMALPIAIYVGVYGGSQMTKDKSGMYYPKAINDIERENKKALEWLKKEKDRIEKGTAEKKSLRKIITGKQESSIFESVQFI